MTTTQVTSSAESNTDRARKCLALIRDIAARGALSVDPDHVGYVLQELTQILLERTGTEERYFEPISAAELTDLAKLYEELEFADGCSQDMDWKEWNGITVN